MKSNAFRTAQGLEMRRVPPLAQASTVLVLGLALALAAPAKDTASAHPVHGATVARAAHARLRAWREIGTASWYGSEFQGRKTANGELFDMYELTCAHPTLPMGTWLKVTNLHNHRTAYVRVNDRGPAIEDRIVDLSFGAARVLRLHGVGKVKLERLSPNDPALIQGLLAQVHIPVLPQPKSRPGVRLVA